MYEHSPNKFCISIFNVKYEDKTNTKTKEKVELGRVYKIGGKMILVPKKAVEKLVGMNEPAKKSDVRFDRKVCYTWLLSLVSKPKLAAFDVDDEIMDFIQGDSFFLFYL